jgi:lipopolysaccharide/colanic/teichoic acid biosynthesis glycosyltransferase
VTGVRPSRSAPLAEAMKRTVDVLLTLGLSTPLFPVALVVAAAVLVTSGKPVLHRAERIGRGGRAFTLYKFRTMVHRSKGPGVTHAADARITTIGRILRRTKFDEFPQVLNVLRGDMSIVGPRPEAPQYVERYTPLQREVLRARPGLTSLAQVIYRDEETLIPADDPEEFYVREVMPRKLALDLLYVRHWSPALDGRVFLLGLLALARVRPPASLWPPMIRDVLKSLVHSPTSGAYPGVPRVEPSHGRGGAEEAS